MDKDLNINVNVDGTGIKPGVDGINQLGDAADNTTARVGGLRKELRATSEVTKVVGESLGESSKAMQGVGEGGRLAYAAIELMNGGLKELAMTILANPIFLLSAVVTGIILAMKSMADAAKEVDKELAEMDKATVEAEKNLRKLQEAAQESGDALLVSQHKMTQAQADERKAQAKNNDAVLKENEKHAENLAKALSDQEDARRVAQSNRGGYGYKADDIKRMAAADAEVERLQKNHEESLKAIYLNESNERATIENEANEKAKAKREKDRLAAEKKAAEDYKKYLAKVKKQYEGELKLLEVHLAATKKAKGTDTSEDDKILQEQLDFQHDLIAKAQKRKDDAQKGTDEEEKINAEKNLELTKNIDTVILEEENKFYKDHQKQLQLSNDEVAAKIYTNNQEIIEIVKNRNKKLSDNEAKAAVESEAFAIETANKMMDDIVKADAQRVKHDKTVRNMSLADLQKLETDELQLEVDKYAQLESLGKANEQTTQDHEDAITAIKRKATQERNKLIESELAASANAVNTLVGIAQTYNKQSEQAMEVYKALALTKIGIDAAKSVAGAVSAASDLPYPSNLIGIATGVAAVLADIAQANDLLSSSGMPTVPTPSAPAAASTAPSSSGASFTAPQFFGLGQQTGSNNASQQTQKVVVVESDITKVQKKVAVIQSNSKITL